MLFKKTAAVFALTLLTTAAFGQQRPADLTVSKNLDQNADAGMFNTIQAAVNAARPGNIIEITDNEVYNEQVTIDGRETSPWPGVTGGKNGITIRSRNPTGTSKPTIRWQDTQNQSPKSYAESQVQGDQPGSSGNFETCGALRVLRAQGITIDGIIVDGGGAAPFGWASVWGQKDPLIHGNAAITLAIASNVTIRNCEMRNAYFGVNVKDRNTGGVFGNKNPNDNDYTIPMSAFGQVGGHLIEYNRVHGNSLAFFFESAWDLGSSVRYNLIYSNYHRPATLTALANLPGNDGMMCGAFMFKDMVYSPLAIYNNTFYDNTATFFGHWQVGAQHLIFNNIFGRKSSVTMPAPYNNIDGQLMDKHFPNRTNNSLYSAVAELTAPAQVYVNECGAYGENLPPAAPTQVRIYNGFPNPPTGAVQVTCSAGNTVMSTGGGQFRAPGGLLVGEGIPASAELRWLETSQSITGTHDLFISTDPASPDFLRPKWTDSGVPGTLVTSYVKNKGWPAIGIRNSDGNIADIGALSSTGSQPATVARIKPTNVVLITGSGANTNATASFYITLDKGQLNNPKIKFMRWVSPLPIIEGNWGGTGAVVPATSIRDITPPANVSLSVGGNNTFTFPVPAVAATGETYGFFEIVVEGTDANGNLVATDVGFLPYRTLQYILQISVLANNGVTPNHNNKLAQVTAGDTVRLYVEPRRVNGELVQHGLNEIIYDLLSTATAQMLCVGGQCPPALLGGRPLKEDNVGMATAGGKVYNVVFTRAGEEVIMGTGRYGDLVFLGSSDIRVRPGVPDRVVFSAPIPKSRIPAGTLPPVINPGARYEVLVEVQDRFENPVDVAVPVTIGVTAARVSATDATAINPPTSVGNVGSPSNIETKTVSTDPATGTATFVAVATGRQNNVFDMTATITQGSIRSDEGTLRVGRTLDRLLVFYADTGSGLAWNDYYDQTMTISGRSTDPPLTHKVTVKAVDGTSVLNTRNGCVQIEPDLGLALYDATGNRTTTAVMTNGVATFWVGAEPGLQSDISDACIAVNFMNAACSDLDPGVNSGSRCGISFEVPQTSIYNAVVFGNGNGRPDSVYVRYAMDGKSFIGAGATSLPDSVLLKWPTVNDPGVMIRRTSAGNRITAANDSTVKIDVSGATTALGTPLPNGYTNISGNGMGLVTVYGGQDQPGSEFDFIEVLDGIGLLLADGVEVPGRMSPMIVENLTPAVTPDTLIIQLTEQMFDPGPPAAHPFEGRSVLYAPTANDPATGGTRLEIQNAFIDVSGNYKLIITPGTPAPRPGDWVRINPEGSIEDIAAVPRHNHPRNAVHANNRWVQVRLRVSPPDISEAWYTSDVTTGKLDYIYIRFNKPPDINEWFANSYFKFDGIGNDSLAIGPDVLGKIDWVSGGDNPPVRINLSALNTSMRNAIATGGGLRVSVGFNPAMGWDPVTNVAVNDRAKPVLADTVRLKIGAVGVDGGADAPDTLELLFSEVIPMDVLSAQNPVIILTGSGQVIPTLSNPQLFQKPGSVYYGVTYVVNSMSTFPSNGDMVYINTTAQIYDAISPPNIQDQPDNLRQPLIINYGETPWSIRLSNNPFRSGSSAGGLKAVLRPGVKGARVVINSKIRLYNNMGNLVFSKDQVGDVDSVAFVWDGYNTKGRMAGTGTYLLRISSEATIYGQGGGDAAGSRVKPYTVQRPVGFIRGKQ